MTRKLSQDKGVKMNNFSSDVELEIKEPIQAEVCRDRNVPASKR